MPWKELSIMSLRWEFVGLASQTGVNFSQLCQGFGISRDKGYKWLKRYRAEGPAGLGQSSGKFAAGELPYSPSLLNQRVPPGGVVRG